MNKRLNTIQLVLAIIAIGCGAGSGGFGYLHKESFPYLHEGVPNLDTGYDGGAIGLGIISAAALIMFVQLEIARMKK